MLWPAPAPPQHEAVMLHACHAAIPLLSLGDSRNQDFHLVLRARLYRGMPCRCRAPMGGARGAVFCFLGAAFRFGGGLLSALLAALLAPRLTAAVRALLPFLAGPTCACHARFDKCSETAFERRGHAQAIASVSRRRRLSIWLPKCRKATALQALLYFCHVWVPKCYPASAC